MELLFRKKISSVIETERLIADHQFGFRKQYGSVAQVHRVVGIVNTAFDEKKCCTSVFLDIAQAFDKVWHDGLLYKAKNLLPFSSHLTHKKKKFFRQAGREHN